MCTRGRIVVHGREGRVRGGRPVLGGHQGVPGPFGQSAGWLGQASASCETTPQPATASACACARTPPAQSPVPPQTAFLHPQCQENHAGSVRQPMPLMLYSPQSHSAQYLTCACDIVSQFWFRFRDSHYELIMRTAGDQV